MKKIIYLCFLIPLCFSQSAVAASVNAPFKANADSLRKKMVHPREAMTDVEVSNILSAMRQKVNDPEKVQVLKDGFKNKGIMVEQLIKLLNQFLTDDSKIESAKYAFAFTVNYKAFLKIMDLFAQEDYKYKLEDFYDKNRK